MKKVIGIVVGALVCSLAATAFAEEATEPLSRLGAGGNIALLYNATGNWGGNTCTNKSALIIDLSTEGGRAQYHTALAAYLAGKQIKAFWSACHTIDGVTFPKTSRIDIVGN